MEVVIWDTRKLDASKEFAGGYGVGLYPRGGGLADAIIRRFYTRDRRPVPLVFAHLTGALRTLGHQVSYSVDRVPPRQADLYLFCPSLITLHLERQAITELLARFPSARVLVVGPVASVMPEAFTDLGVTVVQGEAEQLFWRLDDVLGQPAGTCQVGAVEDLDCLPLPDWSPFRPRQFRIGYDFRQFPTALIQASRGCPMRCNYCPYIVADNSVRFRDPQAVVEEMRYGMSRWGFRSFKFRDPLFGASHSRLFRLADLIGQLPRPIQFSIETRIDVMRPETLRALKRVGLSSITVGIETPDDQTLQTYRRAPIEMDRQREFLDVCRRLGIRTVAGFMIGFPSDTDQSIRKVLDYALELNPTFANFNVVTPYPGTPFFQQIRSQIADFDYSRYTVYTPVLKYDHLSRERVSWWVAKCFRRFYFRWSYATSNAAVLWPKLRLLGVGREPTPKAEPAPETAHSPVPKPLGARLPLSVLEEKGLRCDAPHRRTRISDLAPGSRHEG
ncbi:MAG: B12-binding domain-containing radical SAM protein [Patescibacteria group bacterium]|nr:B12-binding domain-containing radical SAM protein [Patescibacteria group bacterium]